MRMMRVKDSRVEPVAGELAALVRASREHAGLTQRQLAERAGVGLGALEDIEQGRTRRPRQQSLARLAVALGLDVDQLALGVHQAKGAAGRSFAHQSPPGPHAGEGLPYRGLRVGVLGPLVAWRDGQPVALGPVRMRTVLGLLVLYCKTGLPRAAAVDALWGEDPPPTAVAMVQEQVSRIRRLLVSGPVPASDRGQGVDVSWAGSRYQLSLGSVSLDVAEFDELAAHARRAVGGGDAAAACEWYERALGLWRGRALEDIEALRGHPAVIGLDRRRTEVVLEYAGAAADAGQQDAVVVHLEALTAREPLDERAHARLMVTLAATGRQARALRVYQDLARRLDAELGVKPGHELAEAHLQVLRQQVQAAANADGLAAAAAVPRQLPAGVPGFTGRIAELAVLDGLLDQAAQCSGPVLISAIGGTAGVGKTALAIHW